MTKQKSIFFFILFFLFVFSFCWGQSAFGQPAARPLEIQYPSFPQVTPPQTVETPVTDYVKYLYYFFIFTAGFFALGALVYASFRYITSAGSPEAMKDAKDQISAALLGVLILVSSWIILNQINPQLTVFRLGPTRPFIPSLSPGVLLCKERVDIVGTWNQIKESENLNKEFETASSDRQKEIITKLRQISSQVNAVFASTTQSCWKVPSSGDIPDPFNDKTEWIYLIPSATLTTNGSATTTGSEYGAIVYEKTKFNGESLVFYTINNPQPTEWDGVSGGKKIADLKPSSIKPFILNYEPQPRPVWDVTLYELIDYNKADPNKWNNQPPFPSKGDPAESSNLSSDQKISSIKIEGELIVIFFKTGATESNDQKPWQGELDVFTESDSNLNDNKMGTWCGTWPTRFPCAAGMVIVSDGIY